eukprot:g26433.t1
MESTVLCVCELTDSSPWERSQVSSSVFILYISLYSHFASHNRKIKKYTDAISCIRSVIPIRALSTLLISTGGASLRHAAVGNVIAGAADLALVQLDGTQLRLIRSAATARRAC